MQNVKMQEWKKREKESMERRDKKRLYIGLA